MKRSKWFGLWNNSEKHYMVSQPVKIDDIKQFVNNNTFRLIVKKNKYYQKNGNRPYYCFAIGDSYNSASNEISSWDMQYENLENELSDMTEYEICDYIEENYNVKLYTYNDLRKVMREANYDGTQGYTDIIVEDYI